MRRSNPRVSKFIFSSAVFYFEIKFNYFLKIHVVCWRILNRFIVPSRLGDLTRCLFGVVGSTLNHNVGKLDRAKLEGLNGQLSQMWSDRRQSLPHSNPYHSNRSLDQPVQTNLCELIDSVPPKSAKGKFEFFKLTPKAKHEKSKSISIPSNASSDSDQKKSEKPKRRRSRHEKKSNESHVSSIL